MDHERSRNLFESLIKMRKIGSLAPMIDGMPHGAFFMLYRIQKYLLEHEYEIETGVKVSNLSLRGHISMPAVSQMLNNLEERQLIERHMAKDDRRVVYVNLTQKGNQVLDSIMGGFLTSLDEIVEKLGEPETDQLIELLERFYAILKERKSNENTLG